MKNIEEAAKKNLLDVIPSYEVSDSNFCLEPTPYYDGDQMIEMFEQGAQWQQNNQWVSVEDKLPSIGEFVFAYYSTNYIHEMYRRDENGVIKWTLAANPLSSILCGTVTHWMPIPELPKK